MEIPAVSVIISLYNYENYIGECLDSLSLQTFQDFEVIVVDDCSTDSSFNVAKSYAPKFNCRFKLFRMKTNSGGGGEPRNKGFTFSRGQYVFFMDADDVLTQNALEEMYFLAKKFNADVVYCEKYFMSTGIGEEFKRNIKIAKIRTQSPPFVDKPTLDPENMIERIKKMNESNYWVTPWLRLVSRDLLLENDIKFDSLIASNDVNWTYKILFCAKRFLRVPNPYYIRRIHDKSVSFRKRTPSEYIHKWMDRTIRSLKNMYNFMLGIDFFKENPEYISFILLKFMGADFNCISESCENLSPYEIFDSFRQNFGKYLGEHDILISSLCTFISNQQKILMNARQMEENFGRFYTQANQRIAELEKINKENSTYISELENFIIKARLSNIK